MATSVTMSSQTSNTFTLTVPKTDVGFFRAMAKKMGWVIERKRTAAKKPRLYDPETGECLNDKTMKAIEDVRSGKDQGTTYKSFEDFKKAMLAL